MLSKLRIKNFLLINELEIDFALGFTVVTGETGSGKSIIIDALTIVFGDRVSSNIIRSGEEQSVFEVEFYLKNKKALEYLAENCMFDIEDEKYLLCRRIISKSGKSRSYINGNLATIQQMKQLGEFILDVHTQHATITILNSDIQRGLLDEFAQITDKVNEINFIFNNINEISKKIKEVERVSEQNKLEFVQTQQEYEELVGLNLVDGEWGELAFEHKKLSNAQIILQNLDHVVNAIDSDYDGAVKYMIKKIISRVEKVNEIYPKCDNVLKSLDSILVELDEVLHDTNQILNSIEMSPDKLNEVENKIATVFNMARKYKVQPEDIGSRISLLSAKLSEINNSTDVSVLVEQLRLLNIQYDEVANYITKKRLESGDLLSKKVNESLKRLGINGIFGVDYVRCEKQTSYGKESIEYKISFNKGIEMQPLTKVISGGELSRVALSLYLLLSTNNPPEVIIFDEIDVGVGGKIAAMVGEMLRELGKNKQVICITHQPQTASYGNSHLVVKKEILNELMTVTVNGVENDDRVYEIARMLSGVETTELTIKHATELLKL